MDTVSQGGEAGGGRADYRDIAARAGCSVASVSRVMRGNARVSAELKGRVMEAASALGYRPDPELSALLKYRWAQRTDRRKGTVLAFVYVRAYAHVPDWELRPMNGYPAAARRAEELGYKLEPFDALAHGDGLTLSRVLFHRGVRGVLVRSFQESLSLELNWDRFASVFVGPENDLPRLHSVSADFSAGFQLGVRKAREAGYRRLGFALFNHKAPGTDDRIRAAALFHRERLERELGAQPALLDYDTGAGHAERLLAWVRAERPDAILAPTIVPYHWLKQAEQFGAPRAMEPGRDVGFVCLRRPEMDDEQHVTHVDLMEREAGAFAVDLLQQELEVGRLGVPAFPGRHLMPVRWSPGSTLPKALGAGGVAC